MSSRLSRAAKDRWAAKRWFTVYAPPGIGEEAVYSHLQDIRQNVLLVAPQAQTEALQVYGTE